MYRINAGPTHKRRNLIAERRINYFRTWRLAFEWLTALSPIRQEGSELRPSDSADPRKRWMVIEIDGPSYADAFDLLPLQVKQSLIADWLPPTPGQPTAHVDELTHETKSYLMRLHNGRVARVER